MGVWNKKACAIDTYTPTCLCYIPYVDMVLVKKNTFFKPLPFALKIIFGAEFVSVFPLYT